MKINLILILVSILSLHVNGQKEINITGKIIDKETKEPLPFATIIHQSKSIGTISDINGHFKLSLTDASESDTISISFVGYETKRVIISECKQIDTYELKTFVNKLNEVVVTSKKFKLKGFIKEVITEYNNNKREDAHIAIAHYKEKAKVDNQYIMYMESVGYSLYAGRLANAAPLSNYKFFCENTKCHVINPKWISYKENRGGYNTENVLPGGGANLNLFRYFEQRGLLSKKHYSKYNYKKDSTYYIGNIPVYCISFKGNIAKGAIHVYANSKQILKIECTTTKYWSTAFHKRVDAQISIQFNYFEKTPFISKVQAKYKHEKLEYHNTLEILTQKFNNFELNTDEYWSMNTYDHNPYIEYIPEKWAVSDIKSDEDYNKIKNDLSEGTHSLEKQFEECSGRWFFSNGEGSKLARSTIKQLKQNF